MVTPKNVRRVAVLAGLVAFGLAFAQVASADNPGFSPVDSTGLEVGMALFAESMTLATDQYKGAVTTNLTAAVGELQALKVPFTQLSAISVATDQFGVAAIGAVHELSVLLLQEGAAASAEKITEGLAVAAAGLQFVSVTVSSVSHIILAFWNAYCAQPPALPPAACNAGSIISVAAEGIQTVIGAAQQAIADLHPENLTCIAKELADALVQGGGDPIDCPLTPP